LEDVPPVTKPEKTFTAAQTKRLRSDSPSAAEIALNIRALTTMLVLTRGEHWSIDNTRLMSLAEPLSRGIAELPATSRKQFANLSLPISILMGFATCFGPALKVELDYYNEQRKNKPVKQATSRPVNQQPVASQEEAAEQELLNKAADFLA
jgi:hypothetical protein